MGGCREAPGGQQLHHIPGVHDHDVWRCLHGKPLAVPGEDLQSGSGRRWKYSDEVDVFVGSGAHGTWFCGPVRVGVVDDTHDAVAIFDQLGEGSLWQAEVVADGIEEAIGKGLLSGKELGHRLAKCGDLGGE